MADPEEVNTGGETIPTGGLTLEVNPPKAARVGTVRFNGARVIVEYDGDHISAEIVGAGEFVNVYGEPATTNATLKLNEVPTELISALQKLLDAHVDTVVDMTMEAAYEHRRVHYTKDVDNGN